jgi:antirestriction protein
MHERDQQQGGERQTPETQETTGVPRVYVASLADYNAGRLHGEWIDLDDAQDLGERVQAMLRRSSEPVAEEWAIHDYEGFGPLHLGEYESLDTVAMLAQGIRQHGPAFAHWVALEGATTSDLLARFEDAYLGHWESIEAFAESLFDDFGYQEILDQAIPEHLQPYLRFDAEAFARDLNLAGDITTSEGDHGIYVFNAHA